MRRFATISLACFCASACDSSRYLYIDGEIHETATGRAAAGRQVIVVCPNRLDGDTSARVRSSPAVSDEFGRFRVGPGIIDQPICLLVPVANLSELFGSGLRPDGCEIWVGSASGSDAGTRLRFEPDGGDAYALVRTEPVPGGVEETTRAGRCVQVENSWTKSRWRLEIDVD